MNFKKTVFTLLVAFAPGLVSAATFPSKPIKIVVPIAVGGANDLTARALAAELQDELKVPVVVDNRPGGNFVIGNSQVYSAAPDGYTLGWAINVALSVNPLLYKDLPYKPEAFAYLSPVSKSHHVIAVPQSSPSNTLQEWVDGIKNSGRSAQVAVSGIGTTTHLMAEGLGERAGFNVEPIVYRGEAPATLDLVSGQIPALSGVVASVLEYYKAGKVKILAVSSEQRLPELPDVPTFQELGYQSFVMFYWNGVMAPPDTPKEVVSKLSDSIQRIVKSDRFKQRIAAVPDSTLIPGTPDDMRRLVKEDVDSWGGIIKSRNIQVVK